MSQPPLKPGDPIFVAASRWSNRETRWKTCFLKAWILDIGTVAMSWESEREQGFFTRKDYNGNVNDENIKWVRGHDKQARATLEAAQRLLK